MPVGEWIKEYEKDERIKQRIACPEKGYPQSESLYPSVEAWEEATGRNWIEHIADTA